MEEKICQRISDVLEDKHVSYNALSKKLGMTQPTVLRQVKGGQTLCCSLVERFLRVFPDVSSEWLMRGVGEKYTVKPYKETSTLIDTPMLATDPVQVDSESMWKNRYDELEKRYEQLLSVLGGGMRQSKVNVG